MESFTEDQLKIMQRALDYLITNAELTPSEKRAATAAYEGLDEYIDQYEEGL